MIWRAMLSLSFLLCSAAATRAAPVYVTGRVVEKGANTPVADASVTAELLSSAARKPAGPPLVNITLANGSFILKLPSSGKYRLLASSKDTSPVPRDIDVPAAGLGGIDLVVMGQPKLSFKLVGANGKAVTTGNVEVYEWITWGKDGAAVRGGMGEATGRGIVRIGEPYNIPVEKVTRVRFEARSPDFGIGSATLDHWPDAPVTISLAPGATLSGVVKDAAGLPAAGMNIFLLRALPDGWPVSAAEDPQNGMLTTAKDGSFKATSLFRDYYGLLVFNMKEMEGQMESLKYAYRVISTEQDQTDLQFKPAAAPWDPSQLYRQAGGDMDQTPIVTVVAHSNPARLELMSRVAGRIVSARDQAPVAEATIALQGPLPPGAPVSDRTPDPAAARRHAEKALQADAAAMQAVQEARTAAAKLEQYARKLSAMAAHRKSTPAQQQRAKQALEAARRNEKLADEREAAARREAQRAEAEAAGSFNINGPPLVDIGHSAADGSFILHAPVAGKYRLRVDAQGFFFTEQTVVVDAGVPPSLSVALEVVPPLQIRLASANGPVPAATAADWMMYAAPAIISPMLGQPEDGDGQLSGDGVLQIPAPLKAPIRPDAAVSIVFRTSVGCGRIKLAKWDAQPKTVQLTPGGTLHGKIIDSKGKPAPDVSIWVSESDSGGPGATRAKWGRATSDKDGTFVLDNLPTGSYMIYATTREAPFPAQTITIKAGDNQITLKPETAPVLDVPARAPKPQPHHAPAKPRPAKPGPVNPDPVKPGAAKPTAVRAG